MRAEEIEGPEKGERQVSALAAIRLVRAGGPGHRVLPVGSRKIRAGDKDISFPCVRLILVCLVL